MEEIRCPHERVVGKKWVVCNSLCGKVSRVSTGELVCRKCKVLFRYIVNADGNVDYQEEPPEGFTN